MRQISAILMVVALLGVACSDDDSGVTSSRSDAADGVPSTSRADDPGSGSAATSTSTPSGDSSTASTTTTTVLVPPDPETTDTTPVTTLPATVGIPGPGERFNEGGVPITLDETAALACANAQFARDSINFTHLEQAQRDLDAAADRAEPSEVPDIAASSDSIRYALDDPDPLAVVEVFIGICVEHGHQI